MASKIGWFYFTGTGKRHYFNGDLSLCRWCLLTRNPDKDPVGDDHPQNCQPCKEALAKMRSTQDVGHTHQQDPGSVPADPQS